jgi:uncharacterized membrane protein
MYDRVALKVGAKETLRNVEPHPGYTTFAYLILGVILNFLSNTILLPPKLSELLLDPYYTNHPEAFLEDLAGYAPGIGGYLVAILISIVMMIVLMGYFRYIMKLSRGDRGSVRDLFSAFPLTLKIIGLEILMGIFIYLWSLLFIIPGIVAAYRYRLAPYLLLDNPEMGPLECIRESKRLMSGNKGKLFVRDLSFIGWQILCAITFGILSIWKMPYIQLSYVRFYELLSGASGSIPLTTEHNVSDGNSGDNSNDDWGD